MSLEGRVRWKSSKEFIKAVIESVCDVTRILWLTRTSIEWVRSICSTFDASDGRWVAPGLEKKQKLARRLPQQFSINAKLMRKIKHRNWYTRMRCHLATMTAQVIVDLHLAEREEQKHWTWCSFKFSPIDLCVELCNENSASMRENYKTLLWNLLMHSSVIEFLIISSLLHEAMWMLVCSLQDWWIAKREMRNFHGKIAQTPLSSWVTTRHCNDQTIPAINHRKFLSQTRTREVLTQTTKDESGTSS